MSYDTYEAARLISWSNKQAGIGPLGEAELIQWIDAGVGGLDWAFTYKDNREEIWYIDFPSLISLRLICRLHFESPDSKGVPLEDITAATSWLKEELGVHWPFASKEMWNPSKPLSMIADKIRKTRDIKAEWKTIYNILYLQGRGRLDISSDLEFGEDGVACVWLPVEGIKLDPQFVTGRPCLAGTRIPTWVFPGMVRGGDSIEELSDAYDISKERVKKALDWEKQLADAEN